ncbi:uncharacterized protein N7459_001982 [Penicillium hispanicum]|uniref:uncharacterized protein n=1 Tax=Penicillium hispanicum TaxID=1080232 RepID=UPI0025421339|nr:uncharacterized protein N7459_001982 [Penicillium hispanicum]KAJ5591613.1 hypothetical protein N7459_001982 [Penicillium hispanicum]
MDRIADLPAGRAASTHSLQSLDDDLPPPYTDEPDHINVAAPPRSTVPRPLRLIDSAYGLPGATDIRRHDAVAVTLAPILSRSSDDLYHTIRGQMKLPMRPLLSIRGSHSETSKSSNQKQKSKHTVTDFDFHLDLAETMLTGWEGQPTLINWMMTDVIKDGDERPAYRGGILRSRAYKPPAQRRTLVPSEDNEALLDSGPDAADANAEHGNPQESDVNADLKLWCQRFCDDPAPVKSYGSPSPPSQREDMLILHEPCSFTLHRELRGFEEWAMRDVLASHIRSLNYRGSLSFSFTAAHSAVTIYSPHWINRLRANRYIWWMCVILQLWIVAWPTIFLLEKRYEVVRTCWNASLLNDPNSRLSKCYARGRDEPALAEYWAPAVKQAAWTRRQGEGDLLTRLDAERLQGLSRDEVLGIRASDSDAERERRDRVNRGEGGFVDGVVGLVRGIGEVSQDWRLTMGWGGNS